MPRFYNIVTSVDGGVGVERPRLTAAGEADLASAIAELTTDGVYTADEHAKIYGKGLERYFRNNLRSRQSAWDKKADVLRDKANLSDAEIAKIIGKRPS